MVCERSVCVLNLCVALLIDWEGAPLATDFKKMSSFGFKITLKF